MSRGFFVSLLISVVRIALFFWHPVFRVKGRENVIKNSKLVICANHTGMTDPIWVVFALKLGYVPRIMAKKEVIETPVLGSILKKLGVFGVDRENADIHAIKTGLRCLNDGQQLLIFPEGTRVKEGEEVSAKRGAVTLAARTNAPIQPVYITRRKWPFCLVTCVIGQAYSLEFEGRKATDEELDRFNEELMEKIYRLGENV